jgi:Rrf2 family protein
MRLELTSRTDLALRAIRLLEQDGGRMKRAALADHLGTSADFLARVMGPLVHQEWILSETGPAGGYELGSSIRSVSVLQLIDCVEGVPEEGRCVLRAGPCETTNRCALHDAWTRARKALTAELDSNFVID